MDNLIPVVNKLQDVFGAIGHQTIDLPQIVVVGSQSVGKSSVLENIVGRDFLPRGVGVVTRRPLILQLHNISKDDGSKTVSPRSSTSRGNLSERKSGSQADGECDHFPPSPPTLGGDTTAKNLENLIEEADENEVPSNSSNVTTTRGQESSSESKGANARKGGSNGSKARNADTSEEEYGEFLHLPGQRFFDFAEIRNEIQRETDRISGKNKGISNKSINLKIYSPHVLNLTLVDLPGITKVPTGDQPEDVEEQIRSMCYEFTSNPNAIILAVTAANHDLVNSDGLKMARAVDPDGERTIGVLTKVDIMDHGTDCAEILANRVVPLRRGYIAIMNRSQRDIMDGHSIRDGLSKENMYFGKHPKYRNMMSKCGTQNLARMLNQILMLHIRDCLPEIKSKVMGMMTTVQTNIDALGEPTDDQSTNLLGATLLQLLSKFARSFANSVEGRSGLGTDGQVEMSELCGGARISYIFNDVFGRALKHLSPFEGLDDEHIRTAIANANGPRPSLFVPEIAFDLLVKKQIEKLLQPGLQCVDLVFDEMQRMAFQSENPELSRFPELRDRMFEIVQLQLRAAVAPTQKMITNLISIELAYINTSHPDFIGGKQAVAQLNKRFQQQQQQTFEQGQSQNKDGNGNSKTSVDSQNPNAASPDVPRWAMPNSSTDGQSNGNGSSGTNGNGNNAAGLLSMEGAASGAGGKAFFNIFKGPSSTTSNNMGNSMASMNGSMGDKGSPGPSLQRDSSLIRLPNVPDKMRSNGSNHPTERERVETEIIKALIASYFDIVKKNFTDLVPKTIMHFLVNTFKETLQNELVKELYRETIIADLMKETEDVASRRKACREMKDLLKRGLEIINEVRDFNTFK